MRFKDLFDRDILGEATVRKNLKIFYRIDIDLIKNKQAETPQQNTAQQPEQPQPDSTQQAIPAPETAPITPDTTQPADNTAAPVDNTSAPETAPTDNNDQSNPTPEEPRTYVNTAVKFSVVTEDDELASDNNRVMRKFSNFDDGIDLSDKEEDIVNSFQDILDKLAKTEKDGTPILDDYCIEIINLLANKKYDQIRNDLDKKTKIFIEIIYGYNKTDSVGIRFSKSANSDTITSLMLVDNKIISMPFDINKFNERLIALRNEKISD